MPEMDPVLSEATKITRTEEEWRSLLSPEEFSILRKSGTERAGGGRYLNDELDGAYHCAGCGQKLYTSQHKFHSGCGWPSFFQEIENGSIQRYRDESWGRVRVEMRCSRCDGHLGHIFEDAPQHPTGLRHCVNGGALIFVPSGETPQHTIMKHREIVAAQKSG